MNPGSSSPAAAHGAGTATAGDMLELKVKTLDSNTYTFCVPRSVSVASLKELIAAQVGVPGGSQRLIYRGKVLKDDYLLSAYNVEDGHTLHLVARHVQQPSAPAPPDGGPQPAGATGVAPGVQPSGTPGTGEGNQMPAIMMGFNINGASAMTDVSRMVADVLNSMGLAGIPGGPPAPHPNVHTAANQWDTGCVRARAVAILAASFPYARLCHFR